MDYARLYKALCDRAGLRCTIVDGYVKTNLESVELPPEANHSWNAVYADGQWQLVDATWAGTADELTSRFETSYFFTPPKYFILNHLPQQPMWQLLPCPISAEAFSASASAVKAHPTSDRCMAYADSIQCFLQLPSAEQPLQTLQQAYAFHPTADNQRQLAHAMIDYAVYLDEQAETLPLPDSSAGLRRLQKRAIQMASKAAEWVEPQDWQQQLLAQLHLNHAIALYQDAAVTDEDQLTEALQYTEEGLRWLARLPEGHYYRSYAQRQCDQLLEQLHYLLDR